jgi:hypothetical protein
VELAAGRVLRGATRFVRADHAWGCGLVEGSLTLALVAGGGTASAALAAVLLYRLISYWGTLPVGGIGYLVIRRTRSAADCAPAELPVVLATPVLDAGVS